MRNSWLVTLFLTVGMVFAAPVRYPGPTNGVNPVPASENTWRACGITAVGGDKLTDDDYIILPGEFFELEYGKSLEPFSFTNGFVRRWGCTRETPDEAAIMFPRGWGNYPMGHWAVVVDFEQDAAESEWSFASQGRPLKFKLTAQPGERGHAFLNCGMIRLPGDVRGMTLNCSSTNNVNGVIHSFKLVAYTVPLEFRKKITLDKVPSFAGASAILNPFGEIIVNGETVDRAVRVRADGQIRRVDITKYLKVGENTVGFRRNAACGWGSNKIMSGSMEFFTVDEEGNTTVFGSDSTWEARISNRPWTNVKASSKPIGTARTPGGFEYQNGSLPMHAGALRVEPVGESSPVFDFDGEVAYELKWPDGVKDAVVKAVVTDSLSGEKIEDAETKDSVIKFTTRRMGAYDVAWKLVSGERTVDEYSTEMIIAGPLGENVYPLEEMETELSKRKQLIHTIHPAEAQYDVCSSNYIGHTGLFAKLRPDCGRVIEACGTKMRETDSSDGAYFAWHIPVGTLGNAHIVEIDYPDDREQVIRSAVFETFPVDFSNNGNPYANAIANATGSIRTGGRAPLTGKVQTMRYVFFPGSRASTVSFESGLGGKAAACSEIRIYEVFGGLPAWDAPKSDRVFMNHTERTLWGQWGNARHPSMGVGLFQNYRPHLWSAAFLATKNRISQLKFEGFNAMIEGLYMYDQGFATDSGVSKNPVNDIDIYYLFAKMYKHNGIKLFIGWEYSLSPALWNKGFLDVSERDAWAGRGDSQFHIDRHGRQASIYWGAMGFDDAHPLIRQSMKELATEIYNRYSKCGIEGLYMICGSGWLPGFVTPRGMDPGEVGFEDRAIRKFESETGIQLGTEGTDPKRFQKRYELLTGDKYAKIWSDWRARQAKESIELVRDVVTSGDAKWRVLFAPLMSYRLSNPYIGLSSTPEERDSYQVDLIRKRGFDISFYTGENASGLEYVPVFNYHREVSFPDYGALVNAGSRGLIRKADAVYYMPIGLNERGNLTDGIKENQWWWRMTCAPVYDTKYANGAAYCDFVDIVNEYTPKTMVHTWLDCDIPTAHDAALREFLKGFYETPDGEGGAYTGVKGVTARVYGDKLQLVNNTPWTVYEVEDQRSEVKGNAGNGMVIPPFAVRVTEVGRMKFRFAPDVEKDILARLDKLLENGQIVRRIRPTFLAKLRKAQAEKDAYLAEVAMRDWEVASILMRAESASVGLPLQKRFEEMLAEDGIARINCGAEKDLTDSKGRLWLKDQHYTGFGTYGNEFTAGCYDRGEIKIVGPGEETDLCYKTEAGGYDRLCYHIPVPEGASYTLKVHIANTWTDSPGPAAQVTVNGKMKIIDTWGEPNPCKYGAHTEIWTGLTPDNNGEISISIEKCPILNGVEVISEKN